MDYFNTSLNESFNSTNFTDPDEEHNNKVKFIMHVVTCIIITISIPLTLAAIYALYSLVQNNNVAPIYVINLLISDLIQLCAMIFWETQHEDEVMIYISICVHTGGLMASVGFMVCVALERFLVIACPLWYRFRRTIKISVVICAIVWAIPFVYILTSHFWLYQNVQLIILIIFLLLPLPLFIFFLGGTFKALSASISVPTEEKRRIVGVLVLVLLIYTLLFLPNVICSVHEVLKIRCDKSLGRLTYMLLKLSPLADLVLYIFMRKGAIDKLLAYLCCCRMDSNDESRSSVAMTTCTQSA